MKQYIHLVNLFLMILFIYPSSQVLGQDESDYGDLQRTAMSNPVISPPPTASELGKYVEIPVGLYTGVPNINIPLYEIKTNKGYSLPISLSYHASGIKVQQRAGNVGLGWSLNAGGIITRVIRGIADDQDTVSTDTDYSNYLHKAGKLFHPGPYTPESIWYCEVESDQYYFNFNGYSGKFYFDQENNIVFSGQDQPLKISYEGDITGVGIPQFTIQTQDGIKYIFNYREIITDIPTRTEYNWFKDYPLYQNVDVWTAMHEDQYETNLVDSLQAPHFRHVSSWYLGKIEFPGTNEDITFEYDSYRYNYVERTGEVNRYGYEYDPDLALNIQYRTFKASLIDGLFLKKINFENGSVSFVPNPVETIRQDVYPSNSTGKLLYNDLSGTIDGNYYEKYFGLEPYLDSIRIFNSENKLIKDYSLVHNYFYSPGYDTDSIEIKHLYYRLKLDSIVESSNPSKPPYTFSYVDTIKPHRYDNQVDFWGYYNENGSWHQIPKLYVDSTQNNDSALFRSIYCPLKLKGFEVNATSDTITGANRYAKENVNQAFVLKKITYPTGGYDEFEYETNVFRLPDSTTFLGGGLRIKKLTTLASPNDTAKIREYTYVDDQDSCSGRIINFPLFAKFYTYDGTHRAKGWKYWAHEWNLYRYSNSLSDLGSTKGSIVGYKNVQVKYKDAGSEEYTFSLTGTLGDRFVIDEASGDTIYKRHTNILSIPPPGSIITYYDTSLFDHAPFIPDPDFDWARGQLLTKKVYDENHQLLQQEKNYYKIDNCGFDTAWYKGRGLIVLGPHSGSYMMNYTTYLKLTGWKHLSGSANNTYNPEDTRVFITDSAYYKYNKFYQLLTEKGFVNNNGDTIKTIYHYTFEKSSIQDSIMVENFNLINYPTTTERLKNSTFLESTTTTYKDWIAGSYAPEYQKQKVGSNTEETVLEYHDYDSRLNPLSLSKTDDVIQSYIWGYNNTLPIAQVINAELDEIYHTSFEDASGSSSTTAYTGGKVKTLSGAYEIQKQFEAGTYQMTYYWRSSSSSEWEYRIEPKGYTHTNLLTTKTSGQIDELRVYPPDAAMTTYTYDPLIGMTSQTDPNGSTTRYEYDDVGRLIRVKDSDGNLLQETEYNYTTQ